MDENRQRIELYLHEIAHVPPLTDEATRQIIIARTEALQQVAQAHLHLVVPVTEEFIEHNQDRDQIDLVCKGNLALLRAIETFDAFDRVTQDSFSSYATRAIRAAIAEELK